MAKPILYSNFMSSASFRVRIALAFKGIDYEYRAVNIFKDGGDQYKSDFKKLNPMSRVPTLLIDGTTLTESLPIIEYLDETRPGKKLLPTSPVQRAHARRLAEIVNAAIQPLQNLPVVDRVAELTGDPNSKTDWGSYFVRRGFVGLEAELERTAGRYCVGDEVTIADLCVAPQVYSTKARFKEVDMGEFSIISRVAAALDSHEAVMRAHPTAQPDTPNNLRS